MTTPAQIPRVALVVGIVWAGLGSPSQATPVDPALAKRFADAPLEKVSVATADCVRAQRWKAALDSEGFRRDLASCYFGGAADGPEFATKWRAVGDAVEGFTKSARGFYAIAGAPPEVAICQPPSVAQSAAAAEEDLADVVAELKVKSDVVEQLSAKASTTRAAALAAGKSADQVVDAAKTAREAGKVQEAAVLESDAATLRADAKAALQQSDALAKKAAEAKEALLAAKEKVQAATLRAAVAQAAVPRPDELAKVSLSLRRAIDVALTVATRSYSDFETKVQNPAWRTACGAVNAALYPEADLERASRSTIRAQDILRKASGLGTGLSNANGLVERPGAPDKIIASIMGALGADRQTNGTQAVFTLNLASLLWTDDQTRLRRSPLLRNLIVRAQLPLDTTKTTEPSTGTTVEEQTPAPAVAPAASNTPEVSRFSLVLGGSFEDETDPRLPANDECYQAALAYLPLPESDENNVALAVERGGLFDVCNRLLAEGHRISWRAGVGFRTEANAASGQTTQKTKTELVAGGLVWAPWSTLYLNLLYQHVFVPEATNTVGGGLSVAGNISGSGAFTGDWARLGMETLMLFTRQGDHDWQWQWRLGLTAQARLTDNTISTFSVGPRFLGGVSNPGFLATIALSYDADDLIRPVLAPVSPGS